MKIKELWPGRITVAQDTSMTRRGGAVVISQVTVPLLSNVQNGNNGSGSASPSR
ncbi:hypothetical protein [Synechococcus sp. CCY9202]|uniref:hypothetical protein n=1 Tax=Synechococcus sp. CCY9202 TaxID=174698 RepID=UPI002B206D12|nr:hypothetical protein [Synechococcus sp. CCY9202]MEA5422348.1 hypothetical protein [Synechococcus sp. CCY9202]